MRKIFTRFAVSWLRSSFRQKLIHFRYITWPRWFNKPCKVEVYLALNDPYSYLLIQLLPRLSERYAITFELKLISENLPGAAYAATQWHHWAFRDAQQLALQYQLTPIESLPPTKAVVTGQQLWQLLPKTLDNALMLFQQTWQDSFLSHYPPSTPVISSLIKNQQQMIEQGFYLPASIFCAGQWVWGLDRLGFLEQAIGEYLQLDVAADDLLFPLPGKLEPLPEPLCADEAGRELEVFISLRSPYSYLGWQRARRLAAKHQLRLIVKPVLPLLMRGARLSNNKLKYIFLDTLRWCRQLQLPFRHFSDPLGQGIRNCYQVFAYAEQQGQGVAFVDAMFSAVYEQGLDLAANGTVEKICTSLSLDFQQALAFEREHPWQQWENEHQRQLTAMEFWGVPCFRYQDISVWGQDRLDRIEQAIRTEKQQTVA